MPSVDVKSTVRFHRDTASRIHALRIQNPIHTTTIGGVTYITDTDAVAALEAVWAAVQRKHDFCVCHEIPDAQPHIPPLDGCHFHTQTGGTTGRPKPIRRTHRSWVLSHEQNAKMFEISQNDTYGILGKLGHSLALYAAMEACHIGADIQFLFGAPAHAQMTQIIQSDVNIIYATPTQLRQFRSGQAPKVRYIFCGGGTLDAATRSGIRSHFPNATLAEFYGASETSFVTVSDQHTPTGTVGRPYPGVTIDIRSPNPQGIGDVWVQSPYLFTDYADGAPAQDWVCVGEVGRLDNGYLTLLGRRDRMVTIADQNVFPEQIEVAIREVDGVRDACVIPVSNQTRGHVLHAYVVGEGVDVSFLKMELQFQFGTMIAPKTIHMVSEIPKTHSGKHDLATVTEWAVSGEQ